MDDGTQLAAEGIQKERNVDPPDETGTDKAVMDDDTQLAAEGIQKERNVDPPDETGTDNEGKYDDEHTSTTPQDATFNVPETVYCLNKYVVVKYEGIPYPGFV
jgi:hypothetical protein